MVFEHMSTMYKLTGLYSETTDVLRTELGRVRKQNGYYSAGSLGEWGLGENLELGYKRCHKGAQIVLANARHIVLVLFEIVPAGEVDAHVLSHFLPASAFVVHKLKKENELLDIDYDMYLDDAVKDVEICDNCFVDLGFGCCTDDATVLKVNFHNSCKSFITSNVESEQTLWNEMVEAERSF